MKRIKKTNTVIAMLLGLALCGLKPPAGKSPAGASRLELGNGKMAFEFDAQSGAFRSLTNREKGQIVAGTAGTGALWELYAANGAKVDGFGAGRFQTVPSGDSSLLLKWDRFRSAGLERLVVSVRVDLKKGDSLSYWSVQTEGLEGLAVSKLVFPRIEGLKNGADVRLVSPNWMGTLVQNPGTGTYGGLYPGIMSMQFQALYDGAGNGFYASCNDPYSYMKHFSIAAEKEGGLVYALENFPESGAAGYSPTYQAVIGVFTGDWMTAAALYKKWAEKQEWSLNSRLRNKTVAPWLEKTALWVWNRGKSEQVLGPAMDLKEKLGLPVSVLWHWWHNGPYDEVFPEYFPPREGSTSFKTNVGKAKAAGVNPIVYMNLLSWGTSTGSYRNEEGDAHAVKDVDGNVRSTVYNIFSGKALAEVCITSPHWRNKYMKLAEKAVNEYGISGIYMDQACISRVCYDKTHGHVLGGGNYWAAHAGMLTGQVRSAVAGGKAVTLSGEGVGESWLPYLDAFLALQVSSERYSLSSGSETIPLFQAVYHEYAITYGNYSSLLAPPYDELWPADHRPGNVLQPLDPKFNRQFLMEQARSFVWGMQPMISNYQTRLNTERQSEIDYLLRMAKIRNNTAKYLLYGVFCRPPALEVPEAELTLSRLSIYAGQKGNVSSFPKKVPTVYHSAWKAEDRTLGIAIAGIGDEPYPVRMKFRAADYGLGSSGKIYVHTEAGRKLLQTYSKGIVGIEKQLEPRGVALIEVAPDRR